MGLENETWVWSFGLVGCRGEGGGGGGGGGENSPYM